MSMLTPRPSGIAFAIAFMIAAIEPVVPASPTPFTPSGFVVARHVVAGIDDRRHVGRARHRVIHERAGDELPVAVVVDGVLQQRLPDPLREPADELALDERVIEHDAGIVHRRIGDDLDRRRYRDRSRPRRCGSRSESLRRVDRRLGVEAVGIAAAAFGARRDLEQRRRAGRCRPPRKRRRGRRRRPRRLPACRRRSALPSPASGRRRDRARCRPSWWSASRPRDCPSGRDRCRRGDARSARPECRASRRSAADKSWRGPVRCSARRCRARACRASNSSDALSVGSAPACSRKHEMPMPRSFLRLNEFAAALLEVGVVRERQRLVEDRREVAAVVGRADRGLVRDRLRAGSGCAAAAGPDRCR